MNYEELYTLAAQVEERLQPVFRGFERTAEKNTKRVLDAFRAHRVSEPCFAGTTGYGYDDNSRQDEAGMFGPNFVVVHTDKVLIRYKKESYFNRKWTGRVYFTLTGLPFCLPGVHLGMEDTTLRASLSR